MIRCRMIARGRVQGVNYRYFVCQQALSAGVTGYVKNLDDGTVEILAEAEDKAALENFKNLVSRKTGGPWGPHVEKLRVEEEKEVSSPSYSSFEISR